MIAALFILLSCFVCWAGAEDSLAPGIYAKAKYDKQQQRLVYNYNGRELISVKPETPDRLIYRKISDGCLLTTPLTQQIFLIATNETPVFAEITFRLSGDAFCMRPRRAKCGEAIFGQTGRPLIYGVNGIYDVLDDCLISWSDYDWEWIGDEFATEKDGTGFAKIRVKLSRVPWIINIKPRYYREHLGFKYHEPRKFRPRQKPVAGWCSWYIYGKKINFSSMTNEAVQLAKKFRPYGLEYFQIDDGFQRGKFGITETNSLYDAWLGPNAKFPKGVGETVEAIKATGLKPGIWMSTDLRVYEPKEDFPNCILRDSDGNPLKVPWLRYAIDGKESSLAETLEPVLRGFKEAGFEYVKIDSFRHNFYDAFGTAIENGLMTTEEARELFRNFFLSVRRAIGEEVFFLPCWGLFSEGIGLADAMRFGMDSTYLWERLMQMQYDLARYWPMQRILFQLDPDYVSVHGQKEQFQAALSTVALSGGLLMLCEPASFYKGDILEITRACLPPLETYPAETGPIDYDEPAYASYWQTIIDSANAIAKENNSGKFNNQGDDQIFGKGGLYSVINENYSGKFHDQGKFSPFGCLWAFHLNLTNGRWCVIQRNALWHQGEGKIPLEKLGLKPEKEYLVFDFWAKDYWQGKFLGLTTKELSLPLLPAGESQTLIVRQYLKRPQFIADTRHVSGGAFSFLKEEWKDKTLLLHLLPQPDPYLVYIYVPKGLMATKITGLGAVVQDTKLNDDRALRLLVSPCEDSKEEVKISIDFGKEKRFSLDD